MYHFSLNCRCKAVLWLAITVFILKCGTVLTQPPHARAHYVRGNNNRDHSSERPEERHFPSENNPDQQMSERHERQRFPFQNNPGQQILDRIKTNLGMNSNFQFGTQGNFDLGKPFANNFGNLAQHAAQNTYNILNKTFENLNQFSMGTFGNFNQNRPSPQPNLPDGNNGVVTSVPEISTSTPVVPTVPVTPTRSTLSPNNKEEQNLETTTSISADENVSHYIGNFPVIPLKSNEIR